MNKKEKKPSGFEDPAAIQATIGPLRALRLKKGNMSKAMEHALEAVEAMDKKTKH